ncbi:hypothetical protein QTN25_003468 [Entamoeba marina]
MLPFFLVCVITTAFSLYVFDEGQLNSNITTTADVVIYDELQVLQYISTEVLTFDTETDISKYSSLYLKLVTNSTKNLQSSVTLDNTTIPIMLIADKVNDVLINVASITHVTNISFEASNNVFYFRNITFTKEIVPDTPIECETSVSSSTCGSSVNKGSESGSESEVVGDSATKIFIITLVSVIMLLL